MIFTSYTYLAFLTIAFVLHWNVPTAWRKTLLIALSYVFYCSWHWQYGFLLLGVTLFNWWYGRTVLKRGGPLWVGIAVNIGALGYFKYLAFVLDNVSATGHFLGFQWNIPHLEILLPLGISFFTFQGVAYLVDVASGEEPLEKLTDFMLFKSFWPQLIAGPIVRLDEMRAQIAMPRTLNYDNVAEGAQRILFGWAKKVLADNIGSSIDRVYLAGSAPNVLDSLSGVVGFGMQIYLDFSAYSDIAIGSALLFGYRFPENFNWPYISRSPREFWNRWHMSLSRWIRDYVFMPMSFASRDRPGLGPLWLLVAMALCGLWHGAAWGMVLWGTWHGILLVLNQGPLRKLFPPSEEEGGKPSLLWRMLGIAITWAAVQAGWVLFRAPSLHQAGVIFKSIATVHGGIRPAILRENAVLFIFATLAGLLLLQWMRRPVMALMRPPAVTAEPQFGREFAGVLTRSVVYTILITCVIIFDLEAQSFVYFQF